MQGLKSFQIRFKSLVFEIAAGQVFSVFGQKYFKFSTANENRLLYQTLFAQLGLKKNYDKSSICL